MASFSAGFGAGLTPVVRGVDVDHGDVVGEVSKAAADRAGVRIQPLTAMPDLVAACRLFDTVWGLEPHEVSEVQPAMLRALASGGHYVAGAYRASDGELVGASMAFFNQPLGSVLHSHITGVLPHRASAGVGAAIKWHQRWWALERGLDTITWTYDPLIARNAFFNVVRLGARPTSYLVDYYGAMQDGPNRGQPTDRVQTVWSLSAPATLAAAAHVLGAEGGPAADPRALMAAGASVALDAGGPGHVLRPVVREVPAGSVVLIGIPDDVETLRRADPALALTWRLALREVLGGLLAAGWTVQTFLRSGWYVLRQKGDRP